MVTSINDIRVVPIDNVVFDIYECVILYTLKVPVQILSSFHKLGCKVMVSIIGWF